MRTIEIGLAKSFSGRYFGGTCGEPVWRGRVELMMSHDKRFHDWYYLILMLMIGIIIGSGCSDPNSSAVEGKVIYDRVEVMASASEPPEDNPLASNWDAAPTGAITVGDTSLGYPGAFGKKTVTVKAIKTPTRLYVRAEWLDAIRDIWPNRIYHKQDTTKDSLGNITDIDSTWIRYKTVDTIYVPQTDGTTDTIYRWYDQDRLAIFWDMGNNGAEGADCKSMCHVVGSDTSKATTGGGTVDLWQWKAGISDPLYLAEDGYWASDGKHLDQFTEPLASVNYDSIGLRPLYNHPDTTKYGKPFLFLSEAVPFSGTAPWPRGFIMPGYVLNSVASGSIIDVKGYASYVSGSRIAARWIVIMSRDLSTGQSDDDINFSTVPAGDSVMVTIAIMDNANRLHSGSKPIYFVFP